MFSDHFSPCLTCFDEGTIVLKQWTLNELFNQLFPVVHVCSTIFFLLFEVWASLFDYCSLLCFHNTTRESK